MGPTKTFDSWMTLLSASAFTCYAWNDGVVTAMQVIFGFGMPRGGMWDMSLYNACCLLD
jgi:hypothetical protein